MRTRKDSHSRDYDEDEEGATVKIDVLYTTFTVLEEKVYSGF